MAEKKLVRKIISRAKVEKEPAEVQEILEEVAEETSIKEAKPKKGCLFCKNQSTPAYTDLATLKKFMTDRAKIIPRARSGACSKHQRAIARNIKYARHLALLPFVPQL